MIIPLETVHTTAVLQNVSPSSLLASGQADSVGTSPNSAQCSPSLWIRVIYRIFDLSIYVTMETMKPQPTILKKKKNNTLQNRKKCSISEKHWFGMFHWHAGAGICLCLSSCKLCCLLPGPVALSIWIDTSSETHLIRPFASLVFTSYFKQALLQEKVSSRNTHLSLLWLFPHPICAEMSIDCYFQLRVLKLNKWYFKNAFIFTEQRVEPAERITDLPPVNHSLGVFFGCRILQRFSRFPV